ncbi:predicted protein [Sclerotinia sclerotiorum 1980 UF-70]|uniref:Uncharacterized protein n=1 Tax=Sclerotinia sclerotiorum (strain ATCC 18683 / 1980 / Ss-1) TaxID=665079 RepID=A7EY68_SCLS1|nr:predicted protein [Sclerotinia sclerotiorum 1980 UF-70]EDN94410.1 predicted protein [Sclerotinia sclerotiorum 1980 UF-70]
MHRVIANVFIYGLKVGDSGVASRMGGKMAGWRSPINTTYRKEVGMYKEASSASNSITNINTR